MTKEDEFKNLIDMLDQRIYETTTAYIGDLDINKIDKSLNGWEVIFDKDGKPFYMSDDKKEILVRRPIEYKKKEQELHKKTISELHKKAMKEVGKFTKLSHGHEEND
jgi:uncharacterized membrane protein